MPDFDPTEFKEGDLIGFVGSGWISYGINSLSWGVPGISLSHVGILAKIKPLYDDDGNRLEEQDRKVETLLFESTTEQNPCRIAGVPFCGTQVASLPRRLESGYGGYKGAIWHYSLSRPLYRHEGRALRNFLARTTNLPYDFKDVHLAGLTGLRGWLWPSSLDELFCSEWVAAAYGRCGYLPTSAPSHWSPNRLARYMVKKGLVMQPRRIK